MGNNQHQKVNIWAIAGISVGALGLIELFMLNPLIGTVVLIIGAGIAKGVMEAKKEGKPVICPACNSNNIQIVNETSQKGRGCLGNIIHGIIFLFIWWIWIFVWLFGGKKTINKTKAICMSCGRQWYL